MGPLSERIGGLPLRWQIGSLVLTGLIAIFVLFGWLGHAITEDAKARTLSEWSSVTRSTAGFIDSEIDLQYAGLERVAAAVAAAGDDRTRQRQLLDDALGPSPLAGTPLLIDREGAIVWPARPAVPDDYVRSHPAVLEPLTTGRRYASGIHAAGGEAAAVLAVPVQRPGERASGVLALVIRPDRGLLSDLVASARGLAHTGHAELVDRDDRVIASSEAARVLHPGEHPDFYEPLLSTRTSAVGLTEPVGAVDPADEGQRHDMAFVPLRNAPWALAIGGSDAELSADAARWQLQIVVFGAVTLGLALILVLLTTRSVARPILALAAASRKIAAGDLATPVPHGGEGEIRILAQAFDDMRRELQSALSELAVEKSRYEGIVTSMADAVVTTDADDRITAFNPAASALTGWTEDAIGRSRRDVIGPTEDAPAVVSQRAGATGVSRGTLRRLDGSTVSIAVTRSTISDRSGRTAGTVHVLRDISAETEVERLKEEFLSTVSHELRTPLGFIMGYATSLLLPDAPDDRATTRRCVEVIAEASKELEGLVDDLLDMAKIGSGTLSVSPDATALGPLVSAAVERIRVRGPVHEFVTAVPVSLPWVLADTHRIEQVLYNLIDNAIKYSPDGGVVRIGAVAEDGHVVVSVADEGLGIRPEELTTIFERFHRGRIARARGIAGTGLGLAICKVIVEAHGGRIWAESPARRDANGVPHGSAVRFTVPIAVTAALA